VEVSLDGERPDLADQPKAEVRLAVADLSSGNSAYDTEMRRRLEARRFPSITGRLTGAAETGSPDTYRTEGDLTFHGVTRRVAVEIQASFDRQQLEASWQQTVDIRDFNLTSPRILMFKVDPHVEVEVQLRAEAERKEHE
jgi:polyisoprenoid-binding protein YceI